MRAILYDIYITTDIIHKWGVNIDEIYIPVLNISVNTANDELNIFETYESRYTKASVTKEFEIADELAYRLKQFLKEKEELKNKMLHLWTKM